MSSDNNNTTTGLIPNFIEDQFPIPWSMTRAEQATLALILQKTKPIVSIEIGTYNGGSLQVISKHSEKVYAIDISPSFRDQRCDDFDNVNYIIGDSKSVVPELIDQINSNDEVVEFILIDGDHSSEGVLQDISNVLKLIPKQPVLIILHDSFNPDCRAGMKAYNYEANKHVHAVELDYITGAFNHDGLYREMWGGFAAIYMKPEKRTTPLTISEYQGKLFRFTYLKSIHFYRKFFWFLKPIYKVFKK